jgi:hypothetical protein
MMSENRTNPGFLHRLDRLHARVRSSPLLYRCTLGTRVLLAVGFIPTGMVKVLGRRFTTMGTSTDVGLFFEMMYQSGLFWRFAGAAQVLAGLLMLVPRTATLGAAIFAPVISSIFVITLSYEFGGTRVVTGMMLLATLYLLAWDWHRLRPLVVDAPPAALPLAAHRLTAAERWIYTVGTTSALAAFVGMRGLLSEGLIIGAVFVAAGALLAAGIAALPLLLPRRAPRAPSA